MAAMRKLLLLVVAASLVLPLLWENHLVGAEEDEDEDDEDEGSEEEDGPPPASRDCKVALLQTKYDFDPIEFEGMWYVISDQGMFPWQHTFDTLFHMSQDYKVYYYLQDDGNLKAYTAGRSLFRCLTSEGILTPDDTTYTLAKFTAQFDSWFLHGRGSFPIWVAATNYNYALLYSCRGLREDGTCDPKQTFAWTLNRNKDGHSPGEEEAIGWKAKEYCLEGEFISMPRTKPCPEIQPPEEEEEEEEKEEL